MIILAHPPPKIWAVRGKDFFMKKRQFSFILYLENLRVDWQDALESELQLPCAYAIHNAPQDLGDNKPHVHLIVCWAGPCTDKCALELINSTLSAPDCICCSTLQAVNNLSYMYQYLVHASADALRKGKYRYPDSARVSLNGFSVDSSGDDSAYIDFALDIIVDNDLHDFRRLYLTLRSLKASGEPLADPSVVRSNAFFFSQFLK